MTDHQSQDAGEFRSQWIAAVEAFDQGEFFECHDLLEEIWSESLGPEREFYQGLIHAAVCLHHFRESNLQGARKMYLSAVKYLSPYAPTCRGLRVDLFLKDLKHCFHELMAASGPYPSEIELQVEKLPRLAPLLGESL
ncbi:MAG: DUF309 domain-containing protein [Planctomycetaceae bacterium]